MIEVQRQLLLKGAWYAIEQAGFLLRDAVTLYQAKAYASAVALALIAREEFGRYDILRDFWVRAVDENNSPTQEELHSACKDHIEKQRRGLFSIVYREEGTGVFANLLRSVPRLPAQTPEARSAREELHKIDERKKKRAPADHHAAPSTRSLC